MNSIFYNNRRDLAQKVTPNILCEWVGENWITLQWGGQEWEGALSI